MAKFKKGQSGNPAGRKPGTSKASKLRESIAEDLPGIIKSLVNAAKDGDTAAAKLLLDRAIPALKPQSLEVSLPLPDKSPTESAQAIVDAVGAGVISADVAQSMLSGLASLVKIQEVDELLQRVTKLENELTPKP